MYITYSKKPLLMADNAPVNGIYWILGLIEYGYFRRHPDEDRGPHYDSHPKIEILMGGKVYDNCWQRSERYAKLQECSKAEGLIHVCTV